MSALQILQFVSRIIGLLFILCYANQFIYVLVALWRKRRKAAGTNITKRPWSGLSFCMKTVMLPGR